MKKLLTVSVLAGLFFSTTGINSAHAAVTVQDAGNVVGTGDKAWSYLVLEGEDYDSKSNEAADVGFARVDASAAVKSFLGNSVLGSDTKASKKGALWTQTVFSQHVDKVTYQVQFAKAGTYYLYMRFTMFENGGNEANYLNEDSFFVPPDFGKDPQTDWPLSDRGGYAEGCCDGGFLTIKEAGEPVNHSAGDEAGRAFWEGNFHWNELLSSQFLNPETQGEPRFRFKYEVTESQVGKPLDFTISYREGGVTIDLFLFSTNPNLMDEYSQAQLDQLLLTPPVTQQVTVQDAGNVVGTGDKAWSYLVLEGEDYDSKLNEAADAGFARVDASGAIKSFLGNSVLGNDTTASKKGALFTQSGAAHSDKVTYQLQFAKPGTYYLYMRFTMFESGVGETAYLNEDSFFVPPDFGKDPQTDWPLTDPANGRTGGYTEGCCDGAGWLFIPEPGDPTRVSHSAGDEAGRAFWEGNFHWNQLLSSQFLNPELSGEPGVPYKYVITDSQLGQPLNFTISYRESGVTVDLFLFSTNPNLMAEYTQAQLDQLLLSAPPAAGPKIGVSLTGKNALLSWPTSAAGYVLESADTLSPAGWVVVTTAAVVVGDQNTVTVDAANGTKFYRLRKP